MARLSIHFASQSVKKIKACIFTAKRQSQHSVKNRYIEFEEKIRLRSGAGKKQKKCLSTFECWCPKSLQFRNAHLENEQGTGPFYRALT